ncbi:hypothetical protein NMG60_11024881 [Bertholletia excelsa]
MGDLHSIAYSSSLHSSSLGWDLGVFNADMSHSMESTPPFSSPCDYDLSSGYLQDALFEFADRSKRRRLLLFDGTTLSQPKETSEPVDRSYWGSDCMRNCWENFEYLRQITTFTRVSGEAIPFAEMKTPEDENISAFEALDSTTSSQKESLDTKSTPSPGKGALYSIDPVSPLGEERKKRKREMIKRVVYPFAVVKPGGVEGDVTLNDINERILMPPTRPVRHPVGDYACRPLVSPHGPGLSGKAIVAFTRIQTQGRGTITIIRTKG